MLVVVLIWLAGLGAAAQFGKISVLFAALRESYGSQGEAALGLVVSVVGIIGVIFGTTAGIWVARIGPRRAMLAALLLGALVSALEASLPPYPVMIALRICEGISHLLLVVVGPTMIAALAPAARRPFAMTLWSGIFAVTFALLALITPAILAFGGAAALLLGHAGYMLALALILAPVLPRDATIVPQKMGNLLARHWAIYASPRLAAPALGFVFYTLLYVAMMTLLPPAMPQGERLLLAIGFPLVSISCSLSLGIWFLGRYPAVRLIQLGYLLAVPGFVMLGLFWGQSFGMMLGGCWVAAGLGIVQGASFAAIPELNSSTEARAEASGAMAQLGNIGSSSGTPLLAGLLASGGPWALSLLAVLACLGGVTVHALLARRRRL